jgi:hypothetical protein
MKTSTFKMIAVVAVLSLVASVATAKNGNGNGNGNGKGNGNGNHGIVAIGLGGNCNSGNHNCNNGGCNNGGYCNNGGNCNGGYDNSCNGGYGTDGLGQQGLGQGFEPFQSSYVVQPGDSFYTVSLKNYGTSANARYIARFNNMQQTQALIVGRTLNLPSISANGQLSRPQASVANTFQGTTSNGLSNFSTAASSLASTLARPVSQTATAPLPKVTVGSTLLVDGQKFGDKQGSARLRVGGAALKVEVVEWTASSVKVHLPQLELAGASKADIEVVRADGTIASKSSIELNTPSEVALAK